MVVNVFKQLSDKKKAGVLMLGVITTLVGGYALVGAQTHTLRENTQASHQDNVGGQGGDNFNRNQNRLFGDKSVEQFGNRNKMMPPQNNGEQVPPNVNQPSQENNRVLPNTDNSNSSQANSNTTSKKRKKFSTIDQSIFEKNNE